MEVRALLVVALASIVGCHANVARVPSPEPVKDVRANDPEDSIVSKIENHADFMQVAMPSRDVAWALDRDANVLKSVDGGEHFRVVRKHVLGEEFPELTQLVAASERVAWLVERVENDGPEQTSKLPTARLHHTEDGGTKWASRDIRTWVSNTALEVSAAFIDEKRAFLSVTIVSEDGKGQLLFRTADSGKTWSGGRRGTNGMGGAVVRTDKSAFAIGATDDSGFDAISRTMNAGESWERVRVPPLSRNDAVRLEREMAFFGPDKSEGVVLGQSDLGSLVLYRTHNAGASWQIDARRPSSPLCHGDVGEVGAFAMIADEESGHARLLRSTRHGIWDDLGVLPVPCGHRLRAFSTTDLFLLPAKDEGTGMYHSTDAGRTWREIGVQLRD